MIEKNPKTQFKINFQPFPSIAHILCDPVYKTCFSESELKRFISLNLAQYKYDLVSFKNPHPSIYHNVLENFVLACI